MSADERRRIPRRGLKLEVHYSTPTEVFANLSQNLNEGGLFIETAKPSPVGTRVDVRFYLPGESDPIKTRGMVVWSTRGTSPGHPAHARQGMGIEFDQLSDQLKDRINKFIQHLKM